MKSSNDINNLLVYQMDLDCKDIFETKYPALYKYIYLKNLSKITPAEQNYINECHKHLQGHGVHDPGESVYVYELGDYYTFAGTYNITFYYDVSDIQDHLLNELLEIITVKKSCYNSELIFICTPGYKASNEMIKDLINYNVSKNIISKFKDIRR
jgi:hypothetical protein